MAQTFEEDRTVVEAQQRRFEQFPDRKTFSIKIQPGGIHARRVIEQMIKAEKEGCNDFLVKNYRIVQGIEQPSTHISI